MTYEWTKIKVNIRIIFVVPSFRLAARARVKKKLFTLVSEFFSRLQHSLSSLYIKTFFGVANCLNGIFPKMGGELLFADKQSRKWLSQIVAKYKERILKCERYTIIYSSLFHASAQRSHLEHF